MREILYTIKSQHEDISSTLTALLGEIQFQDVVRQKIEKVCSGLRKLASYNSSVISYLSGESKEALSMDKMLEELYQEYVMHAQREIHNQVFNRDIAFSKEGPKVELF
ncbi:MAG: condensin-2 complex subunit G2 family protein [Synergistetes bacterium]|nr:condensin-2 complex subunit G2 family protein [Synergistota bacterium]MDW8193169.1 hypothetical protein [Synergistota bacterium]